LLAGAELIATDRDATFPAEGGLWPGTGAIVAALEYATGRTARIIGKPQPQVFYTALDRFAGGRTLVVGDRLDADLGGAATAGLDAAIVLTGVTSRADAEAASDPTPVAVAEDLHSLLLRS
jgi:glycerol-1-phosphatase